MPQLPQERGCFFSDLDTETFPFILLPFQWCVSSACADKSVFALPVIFLFVSLCFERNMFNNSSIIFG